MVNNYSCFRGSLPEVQETGDVLLEGAQVNSTGTKWCCRRDITQLGIILIPSLSDTAEVTSLHRSWDFPSNIKVLYGLFSFRSLLMLVAITLV